MQKISGGAEWLGIQKSPDAKRTFRTLQKPCAFEKKNVGKKLICYWRPFVMRRKRIK
jgi:hypothetical protein